MFGRGIEMFLKKLDGPGLKIFTIFGGSGES